MQVIGVDGCPSGWIAIVLEDGRFAAAEYWARLGEGLARHANAAVIGVDIPIGAERRTFRAVDLAAQKLLGARRSCLFATPPLEVLEQPSWDQAVRRCRRLTGQALSKQSFALRHKVLEVRPLARADRRIIEVHPELSFAELAGGVLTASKKTWAGHHRRRQLLEEVGIVLPGALGEAGLRGGPDDVLDAGVVAWTAHRHAHRLSKRVPGGSRATGAIYY